MIGHYHYQEEIYFSARRKLGLIDINQLKVVELLSSNIGIGLISGFYEDGFPIYFVSRFAFNNLGYTFEEFMEKTRGNFIEAVCPDDRTFISSTSREGETATREFRMINKQGEYVWVNEIRSELISADHRRIWISSLRMVDSISQEARELRETVPHQIAPFLNTMICMARLAARNEFSAENLREYVNLIISSGYHLLEALDGMPQGGAGPDALAEIGSTIAGMRVLVVDDNEVNRELLGEYLAMEKVEVEMAVNGREAVEAFESHESGYYDVIFMDIHMPIMDGYQATDSIRSDLARRGNDVPIIAVTADTLPEDVRTAMGHGMNDHMSKPLNFEELKAVLVFWRNEKFRNS